jgi:hypothetical protein
MQPNLRRDRALIGLLVVGLAANLWALATAKGRAYTQPPPVPLPATFQGAPGIPLEDDPTTQRILPHARICGMRYQTPNSLPTDLVVIASRDPNDMHTPERCLVGSGFVIASDDTREISVPGPEGGSWTFHRLLIQKQDAEEVILYGYDGVPKLAGSTILARIAMKLGGARKEPSYFVRVSSPSGGNAQATEERLIAVTTELMRTRRSWELPVPKS